MNQLELLARITRLVEHDPLGSGWSLPCAVHDRTVTLAGPDHHLLVFDVESDDRPRYTSRIRVRGSFGNMAVPEGIRPHPTIYLAASHTDRQWANKIRTRLLGGGSRGKNYTAALAAIVALHERSTARSTNTAAEQGDLYTETAPVPIAGATECVVRVCEPGELIAGIPAMIGFSPQRSLVVLTLRAVPKRAKSALIDAVMRFDLDQPGGRRLRAGMVMSCIARLSIHNDIAGVLAIAVDDRATEPGLQHDEVGDYCRTGRFAALTAVLARLLAAEDMTLAGAWAVRAIEPEQRWWSLLGTEQYGVLPDPAASALTQSHVLGGRPVFGSRAELTALVAEEVERQREVAALLDSALAAGRDRYASAVRRDDPHAYSRQALEYVLWQVTSIESGYQLMAPELAELTVALRDRAVRDIMFALPLGQHAAAVEELFSVLTRALSGGDRAEAATLLAYSAYTRGDGPLAGVALEAALTADPEHPMALLLETALTLGMRPEEIRRLARSGFHAAAELGVEVGEPTR